MRVIAYWVLAGLIVPISFAIMVLLFVLFVVGIPVVTLFALLVRYASFSDAWDMIRYGYKALVEGFYSAFAKLLKDVIKTAPPLKRKRR